MILTSLEKGVDFSRQSLEPKNKAQTKRIIFLAAYVFEDIGQVLCQEGFYPLELVFRKYVKTS